MPDYFYSCVDCPEHSFHQDERGGGLEPKDHCDHYGKNFTKSWPMRNTPCLPMLEIAEMLCPICGEVMDLYVKGKKFDHWGCKVHGEQEPRS
jgi:hypothetical protein